MNKTLHRQFDIEPPDSHRYKWDATDWQVYRLLKKWKVAKGVPVTILKNEHGCHSTIIKPCWKKPSQSMIMTVQIHH